MAKGFPLLWYKGATPSEQEAIKGLVNNNRSVLDRAKIVIDQLIQELHEKERQKTTYEKASWPYYQAHLNGELEALTKIQALLTLEEQD